MRKRPHTRIEPRLRKPQRKVNNEWQNDPRYNEHEDVEVFEPWYRAFFVKRRKPGPTPFHSRFFLFAIWDDADHIGNRFVGGLVKFIVAIAFISLILGALL